MSRVAFTIDAPRSALVAELADTLRTEAENVNEDEWPEQIAELLIDTLEAMASAGPIA